MFKKSTKQYAKLLATKWLSGIASKEDCTRRDSGDKRGMCWPKEWEETIFDSVPNTQRLERADIVRIRARRIFGRK